MPRCYFSVHESFSVNVLHSTIAVVPPSTTSDQISTTAAFWKNLKWSEHIWRPPLGHTLCTVGFRFQHGFQNLFFCSLMLVLTNSPLINDDMCTGLQCVWNILVKQQYLEGYFKSMMVEDICPEYSKAVPAASVWLGAFDVSGTVLICHTGCRTVPSV